uniref:DDE Tnp4 domain-containing protein n=1 Tax=Oncorhynchus tshawytscha TaxID=74940 RepID=A0A8C8JCK4_ONCTS
MYKEIALEIISLLEPKLSSLSHGGRPLPNSLQVLITLRFLASGIFHRETGDLCGASEATVKQKWQFYEYGHIPGVIGCIDGSHVPIKCPSTPDKATNHDSRIFLNSSLSAQFQRGQHSGLLLGDSGYGQSNFLFTPYINPTTAEQQRYNRAHIRTRGLVKRMFGVWKNRFQCLHNTLSFKQRCCCNVIIATAVLHNYLKQYCCPDPLMEDQDQADVPMGLRQAMTNEDFVQQN